MKAIEVFLDVNGIRNDLRKELQDAVVREKLLECLPVNKKECSKLELNYYYIMFKKKMEA
ncbi:MAG: hypothetical protein HFH15_03635 [Ruminococcus sp.]|nr:hypothetical protein [Ruminococcus sp.]